MPAWSLAMPTDHVGQNIEHMGSGVERTGPAIKHMVPPGMGTGLESTGPVMDHTATSLECMGLGHMSTNSLQRMALERMGANSLERIGPAMGPALDAGIELMGLAMGGGGSVSFDCAIEMEHGNFGGSFTGSFGGTGGHAPGVARKACQIFVRNVSGSSGTSRPLCTWGRGRQRSAGPRVAGCSERGWPQKESLACKATLPLSPRFGVGRMRWEHESLRHLCSRNSGFCEILGFSDY